MAAVAIGSAGGVDGQAGHGGIPRKGEHEIHPLAAFLLISMQMSAGRHAGSFLRVHNSTTDNKSRKRQGGRAYIFRTSASKAL
jgi:hypothetical protein